MIQALDVWNFLENPRVDGSIPSQATKHKKRPSQDGRFFVGLPPLSVPDLRVIRFAEFDIKMASSA
ncbi:MAG: hypothetical protein C0445_13260 [Polaromonas sp.]|nr:hypothetical protein [Polaromonas sp.]